MNETKTSTVTTVKNFAVRNKTRILTTLAVASVAGNVVMYRSVKLHNEFLKENGLFDQFYALTDEV